MGEVIQMKDPYSYFMNDKGKAIGVKFERAGTYIAICNDDDLVRILADQECSMHKSELKQLMIMWLALNYPDVLKFDED